MVSRPFVLTVDVEPDDRRPGKDPAWDGVDLCVDWLEALRPRLAARTGAAVRFNWFLRCDPQVDAAFGAADWLFRNRGEVFRRLAAQGDSVGLHVHAWRADGSGEWVADHGDHRWVAHCLRLGHATFTRAWGQPPRTFRFGDRFLSDGLVRLLARLGFDYDLTLEPGMRAARANVATEAATGELPDLSTVSRRPYRPSRRDFRRPARWLPRRLWHLPVTTGCINCGSAVIPRRVEDHHAMVHLNLALDPGWIRGILDAAFGEPLVVSVARTGDAVLAGAAARFGANLEHLAEHPALAGTAFVTPAEAVAAWRRGAAG